MVRVISDSLDGHSAIMFYLCTIPFPPALGFRLEQSIAFLCVLACVYWAEVSRVRNEDLGFAIIAKRQCVVLVGEMG